MAAKTRERILDAALELFNAEGLESVGTRQIAARLGISQGNLCYHFPHKDQLVMALYQRLAAEFENLFALAQQRETDFAALWIGSYGMFRIQYRYKFLMLDFVRLMRHFGEISTDFRQLFQRRRQQYAVFFEVLRAKDWLRADIPPTQFEALIVQNFITGNFWMADAEILYPGAEAEKLVFYTRVMVSQLWPYLTVSGQQAYAEGEQAFERWLAAQASRL